MTRFKAGATRWVFLLGPWAIKVPRPTEWRLFLLGLLGNMQERQFWEMAKAQRLLCYCPIVASIPGGFLAVMRRARPLNDAEWARVDAREFQERFHCPVEAKRDSFGVLEGRIVAIDYGS